MDGFQPPLLTVHLLVRMWCGRVWLAIVWRDFEGNVFGEFPLERLL